jgi:hypothetical protein
MPRALWPLLHGRPRIQIAMNQYPGGQRLVLDLLADSGAGSNHSGFDLILQEGDCLLCGGRQTTTTQLGGAFSGPYALYLVRVQIPQLGFTRYVPAVGIPRMSPGFRGIAGFRFLNRFTYGNFGDPDQFGLEM